MIEKKVFKYPDANSNRAGISDLNMKFEGQKIAIIGIGGTGSYILDLIAKTNVAEIHIYDGDVFQLHNAFRAPGACAADTFPKDKTEFTICLTIFRALQRMQNFGMVSNAVMTICDYDNPDGDKYEYDLSENENFEKLNAVEMGKLYRYGDGFKFQALGSGYVGGMTELFKNFGLDIDEGRD